MKAIAEVVKEMQVKEVDAIWRFAMKKWKDTIVKGKERVRR